MPSSYSRAILGAMQSQPIYAGTVPSNVKAARRAAGKAARLARRAGR